MKVLFVHQNFPGQYLHLARHLGSKPENEIVFVTQRRDGDLPGVRKVVYQPKRPVTPQTHHYLRETESHVLNAQEVVRVALALRSSGFVPDVMVGHNGWGEIWYLKDVFPKVPLIGYFEFFYRVTGADVGFDASAQDFATFDTAPRIRTKNIGNLLALDTVDLGQCATRWQKSLYPTRHQSILHVVHEGVDTRSAVPDPKAKLTLANVQLAAGDEVLTYVARNLEPYRGFTHFMRCLPEILNRRPRAQVIVVGGDDVSYGARLPDGQVFRTEMLKELGSNLDISRVHFLGKVPYAVYLQVLQVSRAHIYLTYPFVLSWSMLEAMAAGCLVIGSRTAPVEEVIRHGVNGVLVDFFSRDELVEAAVSALSDPHAYQPLREAARVTIKQNYDLESICLPGQLSLLRLAMDAPSAALWRPGILP